MITILPGDCREVLAGLEANSFAAVVCDPPYHLTTDKRGGTGIASLNVNSPAGRSRISTGFMRTAWDGGDVAFRPETWAAVLRVLKPGAYLVAFASCRGYHRMVCAIEDAGFIIHPMLGWIFASGFPKATNLSKALDRAAGAEREIVGIKTYGNGQTRPRGRDETHHEGYQRPWRADDPQRSERLTAPATEAAKQWEGWFYGLQSLKPALESICLAQKPFSEKTGYENVLRWGTGALNIDASRVATDAVLSRRNGARENAQTYSGGPWQAGTFGTGDAAGGRWPANLAHDGSPEVLEAFARFGERPSGEKNGGAYTREIGCHDGGQRLDGTSCFADTGTAARFFKACEFSRDELLLCRAKAIMEAWNPDFASTAGSSSGLSNDRAVSVLEAAALLASNAGMSLSACKGLGTSVTPNELRTLAELLIAEILSIDAKCSPALGQLSFTENANHASSAATQKPTGIMPITISHWKSDGSADAAIFEVMPMNSAAGARISGGESRFHFGSKAARHEREGSHPTIKPQELMEWLVKLVTPPNGVDLVCDTCNNTPYDATALPRQDQAQRTCSACGGHLRLVELPSRVLDPFCGTGSTLVACDWLGIDATGIELDPETCADAERKVKRLLARRMRGDDAPRIGPLPGQLNLAL